MKALAVLFLALLLAACGPVEAQTPSEASGVAVASEPAPEPSEASSEVALKDPTTMPPDFWQHAFDGVGKPEPLPGIEIIGPDKFKAQVNDALAFLGKCDAPALAFVQGEIASVQPGVPSGIDTRTARVEFGDTEVYGQSNYTHDTAVYWLARGFVHEAEHERQARAGYDIEATGAGQRALEIDAIHAEDAMLHACASFVPKLSQPQVKAILDYVDGILDGTVKCDTCDTPVDQVSW